MTSRVLIRALLGAGFVIAIALDVGFLATVFDPRFLFQDARVYLEGAQLLHAVGSPYGDGPMTYLYPPLFAQLLTPLAGLPITATTSILALVLGLALPASVVLVSAGHPWSRRVALIVGLALLFPPALASYIQGQVTGLLALGYAFALVASHTVTGTALGVAALLKLTPLAALPAALVRDARHTLAGLGIALLVLASSVMLAPQAWGDWLTLLGRQVSAGNPDVFSAVNLAPPGHLVLAIGFLGASLALARRERPAALWCAAFAGLLVPATFWYNYVAITVPFAAHALLRPRARWALGAILLLMLPTSATVIVGAIMMVFALQVSDVPTNVPSST